jgi:predicted nucleic acid-binding protein
LPAYFFDASAIVKRYLREAGSEWMRRLIGREQPRIFISSLSGAEVVAAIMRKGRTGEVSAPERDRALRAFRLEFTKSYVLIPPEPTVIYRAMDLVVTYPLRAYDAVQLASALALPALPHGMKLTFVSADEGLLVVTKKLRLPVENPNLHP